MPTLILLRHGESVWNKENRFTGWTDVDLSDQGVDEAHQAGHLLKEAGLNFDIAFTSRLKRAIKTLQIVQEEMDLLWVPVWRAWELNERHYGALQGLNKGEMAQKFGEAQVKIWRRSYDIQPPALDSQDERHPSHDAKYADLPPAALPATECLKDTVERAVPFYTEQILPYLRKNQTVLIAAHGNSLRALVKYLDSISDAEIPELNIPTGIPLVYELNDQMQATRHYYLGDAAQLEQAMSTVAKQGTAK